ncbi:MAG: hypothetical protein AAF531_00555 [Actinomycetota bacterium]
MATKTAKSTTKKAAEKTEAPAAEATEFASTAIERAEELAERAQEQYLSVVEQGQEAALRGYNVARENLARIEFPSVPVLENIVPDFSNIELPTDSMVSFSDSAHDFVIKVVENQKAFAKKVLTASSK